MNSTRLESVRTLAPSSGKAPAQIVLLLHGYGSNGADLISLAPHWRPFLPDALFLAPDALERSAFVPGGFQWWDLATYTPQALAAGAARAAPAVNLLIDEQLGSYGLAEENLAMVGFSQGTMLALHVGLRRERRIAAIVGYSGMLTNAPSLPHAIRSKPLVLLVHGSADTIVPVSALDEAEHALQRVGVEVTSHVSPGLGHGVDPAGIELGGRFLRQAFGLALPLEFPAGSG